MLELSFKCGISKVHSGNNRRSPFDCAQGRLSTHHPQTEKRLGPRSLRMNGAPVGVRRFPPLRQAQGRLSRQKKGARTGHGAFLAPMACGSSQM